MVTGQALVASTPIFLRPLSTWRTDVGLVQNMPGFTLGGHLINWTILNSGGALARFTWGLVRAPFDTDADDIDPFTEIHLDWIYWDSHAVNAGATITSLGDNGPVRVRSMRRMEEVGDDLFLAVRGEAAGQISMSISTMLILP